MGISMMVDKDGKMRKFWIRQGDVPENCTMDGFQIMAFVNGGNDPCNGCNEDRRKCSGRGEAGKDEISRLGKYSPMGGKEE